MSTNQTGLSREFVLNSILNLFDDVERNQRWGLVSVSYQAGKFKMIRKEETITNELDVGLSAPGGQRA